VRIFIKRVAPLASREDYFAGKHRQFGVVNADKLEKPFWIAMIRSGASAWSASKQFYNSDAGGREPVWCYQRYGRTTNVLPDGRIIEIAGEHEDHYDPDFCIYNDVTVFEKNGNIQIYSYPAEVFPPTDFHTATQVGDDILSLVILGIQRAGRQDIPRFIS
jgi:hypothetical protein